MCRVKLGVEPFKTDGASRSLKGAANLDRKNKSTAVRMQLNQCQSGKIVGTFLSTGFSVKTLAKVVLVFGFLLVQLIRKLGIC